MVSSLVVRRRGCQPYTACWQEMKAFTDARNEHTPDELWLLEHHAVFTLGQAGKAEHVLNAGNIEVIRTDRGGQVTYHGPGQLVGYTLWDIKRKGLGIKGLVSGMENVLVQVLDDLGVHAVANDDAHGVYVQGKKIASLGFHVRKGCVSHGFSLNVNPDLEPFTRINPCGYAGLEVTDLVQQGLIIDKRVIENLVTEKISAVFGYDEEAVRRVPTRIVA